MLRQGKNSGGERGACEKRKFSHVVRLRDLIGLRRAAAGNVTSAWHPLSALTGLSQYVGAMPGPRTCRLTSWYCVMRLRRIWAGLGWAIAALPMKAAAGGGLGWRAGGLACCRYCTVCRYRAYGVVLTLLELMAGSAEGQRGAVVSCT